MGQEINKKFNLFFKTTKSIMVIVIFNYQLS